MTVVAQLLGPPLVTREGVVYAPPRGKKVWAVLAYLALAEQPPTRQVLASLLFPEAEDPANALRWNLSELRRLLGGPETGAISVLAAAGFLAGVHLHRAVAEQYAPR